MLLTLSCFLYQLRIWSKALSASEISTRALLTDLSSVSVDLQAHYPMDAGSGNNLYDQTGNSIHGSLNGPMWVEVSVEISSTSLILQGGHSVPMFFLCGRALWFRSSLEGCIPMTSD